MAHFSNALGEFILPYDTVRQAAAPRDYAAAADLGKWGRTTLER